LPQEQIKQTDKEIYSMTSEMWLMLAYILGTVSSYFLFRIVYTDFLTGQLIRVLEKEGLIRVERNPNTGDLDVKPAGMDYDEFLERLMDDLEQEQERREKGEDVL
jgi:hypothetical protein